MFLENYRGVGEDATLVEIEFDREWLEVHREYYSHWPHMSVLRPFLFGELWGTQLVYYTWQGRYEYDCDTRLDAANAFSKRFGITILREDDAKRLMYDHFHLDYHDVSRYCERVIKGRRNGLGNYNYYIKEDIERIARLYGPRCVHCGKMALGDLAVLYRREVNRNFVGPGPVGEYVPPQWCCSIGCKRERDAADEVRLREEIERQRIERESRNIRRAMLRPRPTSCVRCGMAIRTKRYCSECAKTVSSMKDRQCKITRG